MLYKNFLKLDLHGQDRISASIYTKEFIEDNYKLGNEKIIIIHGVGAGIIRKTVHSILKKHPLIKSYKLNIYNGGETLVEIKKRGLLK